MESYVAHVECMINENGIFVESVKGRDAYA
jgi:hypothetical protein